MPKGKGQKKMRMLTFLWRSPADRRNTSVEVEIPADQKSFPLAEAVKSIAEKEGVPASKLWICEQSGNSRITTNSDQQHKFTEEQLEDEDAGIHVDFDVLWAHNPNQPPSSGKAASSSKKTDKKKKKEEEEEEEESSSSSSSSESSSSSDSDDEKERKKKKKKDKKKKKSKKKRCVRTYVRGTYNHRTYTVRSLFVRTQYVQLSDVNRNMRLDRQRTFKYACPVDGCSTPPLRPPYALTYVCCSPWL